MKAIEAVTKKSYKICFRGFGLSFLQDFYVRAASPERAIKRLKEDAPRAEVLTCVETAAVGQVFAEEREGA